ncbi:reverse transcriptase family protein [Luteimonas suaedae]|uniref:reverse transcriptase family protein n=1 Tax=Luteimonas suaedae TaxID=2605430 RepID=UPI0011EF11EC
MSLKSHVTKVSRHSIGSVRSLCRTLSIDEPELQALLSWVPESRFKKKAVTKSSGGSRTVYVPHWRYRKILRKINKRILGNTKIIRWPDYVFGSVPSSDADDARLIGRDYIACAAVHSSSKSILKVDICDFFDNVEQPLVRNIYTDFLKYPPAVAETLCNLCCIHGKIPQGAPTSSYLANLVFWDLEANLVARLKQKGLTYTRYVDDITISSRKYSQDFSLALKLVDQMLMDKDLTRSEVKTQVLRSGTKPLLVHSLRVEHATPRIPSPEYRRIRSAVRTLENFAADAGFRTYDAYRRMFNVCLGRVNKLSRLRKKSHTAYITRLNRVGPLPSHRDLRWCQRTAREVLKRFAIPGESERFFFRRKLFRLRERLNLLQRTYVHEASAIRDSLAQIKIYSHE